MKLPMLYTLAFTGFLVGCGGPFLVFPGGASSLGSGS